MSKQGNKKISISRLRLGVVLFIVWWIPIYLTLPFLDNELNANTKKSQAIIAITILTIQGIIGVIGLLLVGKELAFTLKQVKYRKLPGTIGRMLWNGDTTIKPSSLKPKKIKKVKEDKSAPAQQSSTSAKSVDLVAMLKSKEYTRLLLMAAIIGIPISAAAYFFLEFIDHLQVWVYDSLPSALGFHGTPRWWVILPMTVASIFVGLTIKYLPGEGWACAG